MVGLMEKNNFSAYPVIPTQLEPLFFLERLPKAERNEEPEEDLFEITEPKKAILCKQCRNPVTSSENKTARSGKEEHTFFNPQGIVFSVACYSAAPGTLIFGEPSTEFSWFQGYTWRFVACANCQEHLGWFFEKTGQDGFWGLIAKKLIEEQGADQ